MVVVCRIFASLDPATLLYTKIVRTRFRIKGLLLSSTFITTQKWSWMVFYWILTKKTMDHVEKEMINLVATGLGQHLKQDSKKGGLTLSVIDRETLCYCCSSIKHLKIVKCLHTRTHTHGIHWNFKMKRQNGWAQFQSWNRSNTGVVQG